jgi:DNA-binding XRE family transcriptional regulator
VTRRKELSAELTNDRLAAAKDKGGRPTDYRAIYAGQAFKLCLLGATDAEMADFFDVSEQTINAWKGKHPKFLESIKRGKSHADTEVAHSLYKRALGYEHEAVKIFCDKDGHITEAPYRERYPPETTAAIFWLKNRQSANWRDRKEMDLTSKGASLAELLTQSWDAPASD